MTGLSIIEWGAGVLLTVAGIWTAWWAGKKSKAEAEAVTEPRTPYEALADRVMYLEERDREKEHHITRLSRRLDSVTAALHGPVAHILDWIDQGAPPPPPADQIRRAREAIRDLHNER